MTPTFSQFKDSDGQVYDCQITGRDGALLQIRYVRDGQVIEDAWITGDDLTSDKPTVGNPLLIEAERDQLRTQLEGLTKERDEALARVADFEAVLGAIFNERRVNGMTHIEAAQQMVAERAQLQARVAELEEEREETGEAWEQLAATFPEIQVDCDDQVKAAQHIIAVHENIKKQFDDANQRIAQLEWDSARARQEKT